MNTYSENINYVLFKNQFMRNFYQTMLSQNLVNVTIALTIAISFTDIVKSMNVGLITPLLTIFSKNRKAFQIAPIIGNIILFILITFLVYIFILYPIMRLRSILALNNNQTNLNNQENKL
jgi:large-conductance mechanosensitive channel